MRSAQECTTAAAGDQTILTALLESRPLVADSGAQAALSANGQVLRVLRLIGAQDRYIARAFVREGARVVILDLNGDGNPLDDIIGMAGKLTR